MSFALAVNLAAGTLPAQTTPSWKDQGVLNLTKSPHAKLHNVPVRAVALTDGFWAAPMEVWMHYTQAR
ncbi:MAG TPA: hypothetical protein VG675_15140 [Bryobacteraceae bacterium]|nr:hypothetical protein [Bryobacteraceae bacterium]